MSSRRTFVLAWLGGALTTAALLLSMRSFADGDPTSDGLPRLLPYSGVLDKDGVPYSGVVDMTFAVYDSGSSTTALWTETQSVSVYRGAFSVLLGAGAGTTALTAAIESAAPLWIGVTLGTSAGDVPLKSRKRLVPVPYARVTTAVTGANAGQRVALTASTTMSADGATGPLQVSAGAARLTLDGDDLDANGALTLNATSDALVEVGGNLTVGGTSIAIRDRETLVHESDDRLRIDACRDDFAGYTERTMIYADQIEFGKVNGLSTSYTMPTSGANCTDYNLQDNDGSELLYYFCPEGMFFVGGVWQGYVGNNAKALEVIRCCKPTVTIQ